jgi:hypothetical protein
MPAAPKRNRRGEWIVKIDLVVFLVCLCVETVVLVVLVAWIIKGRKEEKEIESSSPSEEYYFSDFLKAERRGAFALAQVMGIEDPLGFMEELKNLFWLGRFDILFHPEIQEQIEMLDSDGRAGGTPPRFVMSGMRITCLDVWSRLLSDPVLVFSQEGKTLFDELIHKHGKEAAEMFLVETGFVRGQKTEILRLCSLFLPPNDEVVVRILEEMENEAINHKEFRDKMKGGPPKLDEDDNESEDATGW